LTCVSSNSEAPSFPFRRFAGRSTADSASEFWFGKEFAVLGLEESDFIDSNTNLETPESPPFRFAFPMVLVDWNQVDTGTASQGLV
jgi:hypothetical protein